MAIVRDGYALTSHWPRAELFGLTGQIRRAAVSIPCNLAEGQGRGTSAEVARFAQIALGSLYELDTLLQIGAELNFADPEHIFCCAKSYQCWPVRSQALSKNAGSE
jgi:four helix bundle protein